ncbi:DUF6064 family protein [Noviherbaspirillum sp.]|uniref:DUF6064 family protein n=1 Tax=Noviherbaspirillum sp. TaxID=1926288 RepID=UPI003FA5A5F2
MTAQHSCKDNEEDAFGVTMTAALPSTSTPRHWSYHVAFFARIHPAAYGVGALSLAGSLCFLWYGVYQGRLHFAGNGRARGSAGAALIVFALGIYRAWSWYAGHWFPAMPTFGLPCPTTIFTIGLLCFLTPPYPRRRSLHRYCGLSSARRRHYCLACRKIWG